MKKTNQNNKGILFMHEDKFVATNHPVRIVKDVVEKIDLKPLIDKYKGGGTSSCHPKMLLNEDVGTQQPLQREGNLLVTSTMLNE
jgi:transposase